MEFTNRFYKESSGRWYIDLPEWPGEKEALEMVLGADALLEVIAQGDNEVTLLFSDEYFAGHDAVLNWYAEGINGDADFGGGMYSIQNFKGLEELNMWLCGVTEFMFGSMPKSIYFVVIV